jgi:hypothetical protein
VGFRDKCAAGIQAAGAGGGRLLAADLANSIRLFLFQLKLVVKLCLKRREADLKSLSKGGAGFGD